MNTCNQVSVNFTRACVHDKGCRQLSLNTQSQEKTEVKDDIAETNCTMKLVNSYSVWMIMAQLQCHLTAASKSMFFKFSFSNHRMTSVCKWNTEAWKLKCECSEQKAPTFISQRTEYKNVMWYIKWWLLESKVG